MRENTYITVINVNIPSALRRITIAQKMEQQVKTIYGLSAQVDGVDSQNNALITLSNSSDLYLTVMRGSDSIIKELRVSDLVFLPDPDGTGAIPFPDSRFLKINLPGDIDLDKSFFDNPSGIAAGRIVLSLWYLPK